MTINYLTSKEAKTYFQNCKISYSYFQTPAGKILIFSTDKGIFRATFDLAELNKYKNATFEKNIDVEKILLIGTAFQTKIWNNLLKIPQGKTISYQELAVNSGFAKSWRAVANALANNNIAYFVPCHKVICKNGELGGYRWGIEKKSELLKAESAC